MSTLSFKMRPFGASPFAEQWETLLTAARVSPELDALLARVEAEHAHARHRKFRATAAPDNESTFSLNAGGHNASASSRDSNGSRSSAYRFSPAGPRFGPKNANDSATRGELVDITNSLQSLYSHSISRRDKCVGLFSVRGPVIRPEWFGLSFNSPQHVALEKRLLNEGQEAFRFLSSPLPSSNLRRALHFVSPLFGESMNWPLYVWDGGRLSVVEDARRGVMLKNNRRYVFGNATFSGFPGPVSSAQTMSQLRDITSLMAASMQRSLARDSNATTFDFSSEATGPAEFRLTKRDNATFAFTTLPGIANLPVYEEAPSPRGPRLIQPDATGQIVMSAGSTYVIGAIRFRVPHPPHPNEASVNGAQLHLARGNRAALHRAASLLRNPKPGRC